MNPVQYIILNEGAKMSPGKLAAQAAHASVEGVRVSAREPGGNPWEASIVNRWYRGGHYAKVVLGVTDAGALVTAERYINDRGFRTAAIIDEGRTEIEPLTRTALGVEVLDKDDPHVKATFGVFKLYRERPPLIVIETDKVTKSDMEKVSNAAREGNMARVQTILESGAKVQRRRRFWQR